MSLSFEKYVQNYPYKDKVIQKESRGYKYKQIQNDYDYRNLIPNMHEAVKYFNAWSNNPHFDIIHELYLNGFTCFRFNDVVYSIEYSRATSGMGGMSEGTPDSYTVKRAKIFEVNKPKETI